MERQNNIHWLKTRFNIFVIRISINIQQDLRPVLYYYRYYVSKYQNRYAVPQLLWHRYQINKIRVITKRIRYYNLQWLTHNTYSLSKSLWVMKFFYFSYSNCRLKWLKVLKISRSSCCNYRIQSNFTSWYKTDYTVYIFLNFLIF